MAGDWWQRWEPRVAIREIISARGEVFVKLTALLTQEKKKRVLHAKSSLPLIVPMTGANPGPTTASTPEAPPVVEVLLCNCGFNSISANKGFLLPFSLLLIFGLCRELFCFAYTSCNGEAEGDSNT